MQNVCCIYDQGDEGIQGPMGEKGYEGSGGDKGIMVSSCTCMCQ